MRSGPRWGYLASTWALLFALLHFFWALGGSWLLASSAGTELAKDRPTWFLLAGLWSVAVALLAAAATGLTLARRRPTGRALRLICEPVCQVGRARHRRGWVLRRCLAFVLARGRCAG
jgi:hypothetical protein